MDSELVAIHEAAHAIASDLLGSPPGDGHPFRTYGATLEPGRAFVSTENAPTINRIAVLLAGALAVEFACLLSTGEGASEHGAGRDYPEAIRLIRELSPGADYAAIEAQLTAAWNLAATVLTENWLAVVKVASVLLEKGSCSGADIHATAQEEQLPASAIAALLSKTTLRE